MFTGIINEIGRIKSVSRRSSSVCLEITSSTRITEGLAIGDSVAVNGVCLSVIKKNGSLFFDVVENTFKNTTLKRVKAGSPVNLENALKFGEDLSGHMVSGHVDGERIIKKIQKTSGRCILDIAALPEDKKYLVPRGAVALDGISLTVAEVYGTFFRIYLIPHTLENTVLKFKKRGDYMNVEFDMMAKYAGEKYKQRPITKDLLREKGFV